MDITLNKVLEYKNDEVINRFTVLYDVDEQEASRIFNETLKWLWLGNKINGIFIDDSTLIID